MDYEYSRIMALDDCDKEIKRLESINSDLLEACKEALSYISELEIIIGGLSDEEYHREKPHDIINNALDKAEGR